MSRGAASRGGDKTAPRRRRRGGRQGGDGAGGSGRDDGAAGSGRAHGLRPRRSPVDYELMEEVTRGGARRDRPNAIIGRRHRYDQSTWEILRTRAPGPLTSSPARPRRRRLGALSRPHACRGNRAPPEVRAVPRRARGPHGAPCARPPGTRDHALRAKGRPKQVVTLRVNERSRGHRDGMEIQTPRSRPARPRSGSTQAPRAAS